MLHPGPLVASAAVEVTLEKGASAMLNAAAGADEPGRAFLRAIWFGAAAGYHPIATLIGRRAAGSVVAAIPLAARAIGPLSLNEVPGSYWPFRSFPAACDANEGELAALLASEPARRALGKAWRLGPVYADDPAFRLLQAAAPAAGWNLITRRLGQAFIVDVAGLSTDGPWPSSKTLRKNRWLERRLAESGRLEFRQISGDGWTTETFDMFAQVESESWVGRDADARDTKFLHPVNRRIWETVAKDARIAEMLSGSLLLVGGMPAAFTFSLRCDGRIHYVANSFSERYREGSPGRVLLYRDFQRAAESGVTRIDWGAGDPGYKSEMGARPGPEILDCLLVRGRLTAALARPLWCRRSC